MATIYSKVIIIVCKVSFCKEINSRDSYKDQFLQKQESNKLASEAILELYTVKSEVYQNVALYTNHCMAH